MNDGSFPLFKGCTRPATFMGVPFAPFFIVNGALLWLGIVTPWKPILVLTLPATFILKAIAKDDPYRFRQWGLAFLLLAQTAAQKRFWDGCVSFVPANAGKRRTHAQWLISPPEWLREKKRALAEGGPSIFAGADGAANAGPAGPAGHSGRADEADNADSAEGADDDAVYAVPASGVRR